MGAGRGAGGRGRWTEPAAAGGRRHRPRSGAGRATATATAASGAHPLHRLQQAAGNQAVAQLAGGRGPAAATLPVQRLTLDDLVGAGLAMLGFGGRPALGKKQSTAHPSVWVREVAPGTEGGLMGDGEVELHESAGIKLTDPLHGAWGTTGSKVVVDYAVRPTKDNRFVASIVRPTLTTRIDLLPESEFNTIDEFAPYYRELRTEFAGDKKLFAVIKARMGAGPGALFGRFATREGTFFHERLHAALQRKDAKRRERLMYAEASGLYADSPDAAAALLVAAVNQAWKGFPDEGEFDHPWIYEKQCLALIEAYERAHPPG